MMPCTMGLADGEPGVSHLRWGARVLLVCGGELAFPRQKVALRRGS